LHIKAANSGKNQNNLPLHNMAYSFIGKWTELKEQRNKWMKKFIFENKRFCLDGGFLSVKRFN